jgi:hypothetical protein
LSYFFRINANVGSNRRKFEQDFKKLASESKSTNIFQTFLIFCFIQNIGKVLSEAYTTKHWNFLPMTPFQVKNLYQIIIMQTFLGKIYAIIKAI